METLYRKVAVTVKAVQFTSDNKDLVYNWAKSIQANVFHDWDDNKQPILKIPTLEGEMECSIGDYLIIEPFPTDWRKLYPCKSSIFNKTYELFDSETLDTTAQLQADKAELLEALEYANRMLKNSKDAMYDENYIESLIQKNKQ